jgi:hypothetical protein
MTRSRARQSKPTFHSTRYASPNKFLSMLCRLQEKRCLDRRWSSSDPLAAPSFDSLFDALLPFSAAFVESIVQTASTQILTNPLADPDQWTIVPATLKILKVLIVELQSALGTGLDPQSVADLADEGSNDDDWEDEPNPFVDLGSGFSKEQLMAYAAEDGPGTGRQKDDETQAFLVDFFKRAAGTQGFAEEFQALNEEERVRLQESAA